MEPSCTRPPVGTEVAVRVLYPSAKGSGAASEPVEVMSDRSILRPPRRRRGLSKPVQSRLTGFKVPKHSIVGGDRHTSAQVSSHKTEKRDSVCQFAKTKGDAGGARAMAIRASASEATFSSTWRCPCPQAGQSVGSIPTPKTRRWPPPQSGCRTRSVRLAPAQKPGAGGDADAQYQGRDHLCFP